MSAHRHSPIGAIALLSALALPAHALPLLDENFDDVPLGTVQSALANAPASLPAGTLWSSSGNTNPVNLRSGTDAINTCNAGNPNQRFSFAAGTTFFNPNTASKHFLVLGDDSGQLAGTPYNGTFALALPFVLPDCALALTVGFDWVFKAFTIFSTDPAFISTDRFAVGIAGQGFDITNPFAGMTNLLLDQSLTLAGGLRGPANATVPVSALGAANAAGQHYLVFGLLENLPTTAQSTNGAAGIDKVMITVELSGPGAFALRALEVPAL